MELAAFCTVFYGVNASSLKGSGTVMEPLWIFVDFREVLYMASSVSAFLEFWRCSGRVLRGDHVVVDGHAWPHGSWALDRATSRFVISSVATWWTKTDGPWSRDPHPQTNDAYAWTCGQQKCAIISIVRLLPTQSRDHVWPSKVRYFLCGHVVDGTPRTMVTWPQWRWTGDPLWSWSRVRATTEGAISYVVATTTPSTDRPTWKLRKVF